MAGVLGRVPYDIDTWAPVVHADPGAAMPLGVATARGAGTARRTRAGAATVLLLPAGTASGARRAASAGATTSLPLTAPAARGIVIATALSRPGAACLLGVITSGSYGGKALSRLGVMQVQSLAVSAASGHSVKTSRPDPVAIPLYAPLSAGGKQVAAAGAPTLLTLPTASTGAGRHHEYVFRSPTTLDYRPLEPFYPALLTIAVPYGLTVWRDAAGEWHAKYAPNPDRLIGADPIYEGGRQYRLGDAERAALTAGGFGDNFQLEEILW